MTDTIDNEHYLPMTAEASLKQQQAEEDERRDDITCGFRPAVALAIVLGFVMSTLLIRHAHQSGYLQ